MIGTGGTAGGACRQVGVDRKIVVAVVVLVPLSLLVKHGGLLQRQQHNLQIGGGGGVPERFEELRDQLGVGRVVAGDNVDAEAGQRLHGHRGARGGKVA